MFSIRKKKGKDGSATEVSDIKVELTKFGDDIEKLYNSGKASREMFQVLSKFSRDAVIVSEQTKKYPDGVITAVNRAACHMFNEACTACQFDDEGYESPLIGVPLIDLIAPDYQDGIQGKISGNASGIAIARCLRRNDETFLAEITGHTTVYREKNVRVCIIRDITYWQKKKEELEESNNLLTAVLENSPTFLVLVLMDLSVDYVNQRFCDRLGYKLHDVLGKPVFEFIAEEGYEQIIANNLKRRSGDGGINEYVLRMKHKNGEYVTSEVLTAPVIVGDDGLVTKSVAIIRELSDADLVDRGLLKIKKLGEILLDMGFINEPQLLKALSTQKRAKE